MKTGPAIITILIALLVGYGLFSLIAGDVDEPINETNENVTVMEETQTPEELGIVVIEEGAGEEAKTGDTVAVHYTGTFTDGEVFDSSIPRGAPITFTLGTNSVIQGWELGIVGMKVGEKRQLTIPSHLAYGPTGQGPIPPDTTLLFDVELVGIE